MRPFLIVLLISLIFTAIPEVKAVHAAMTDTMIVHSRQVPQKEVSRLIHSGNFDYSITKNRPGFNFFLWRLLSTLLQKLLSTPGIFSLLRTLLILFLVTAIVIGLVRANLGNLFYRNTKISKTEYSENPEDYGMEQLDQKINMEISGENFSKATRFLYLKLLKVLQAKEKIDWTPNKTNHEYFYELGENRIKEDFTYLTLAFDHIWYGEFPLDKQKFEALHLRFNETFNYLESVEN